MSLKHHHTALLFAFWSMLVESSFPDQRSTATHDEESYDVTKHDVIIRELKKLRKEQLRDGIPWKTPMSKGVSDLDRIVITKRKRRKRKKRKSLTVSSANLCPLCSGYNFSLLCAVSPVPTKTKQEHRIQ